MHLNSQQRRIRLNNTRSSYRSNNIIFVSWTSRKKQERSNIAAKPYPGGIIDSPGPYRMEYRLYILDLFVPTLLLSALLA